MKSILRGMNIFLGASLMVVGYLFYAIMTVFEWIEALAAAASLFFFSNAKFIIAKNLTQAEILELEAEVDEELGING